MPIQINEYLLVTDFILYISDESVAFLLTWKPILYES